MALPGEVTGNLGRTPGNLTSGSLGTAYRTGTREVPVEAQITRSAWEALGFAAALEYHGPRRWFSEFDVAGVAR